MKIRLKLKCLPVINQVANELEQNYFQTIVYLKIKRLGGWSNSSGSKSIELTLHALGVNWCKLKWLETVLI